MNKDYIVHWILGLLCACIWFWGDRLGIPAGGIALAASVVPGALADAMRKSSNASTTNNTDSVVEVPAEPIPTGELLK
jgi:hypothetical protein